jgi:hypothetical protein
LPAALRAACLPCENAGDTGSGTACSFGGSGVPEPGTWQPSQAVIAGP